MDNEEKNDMSMAMNEGNAEEEAEEKEGEQDTEEE
jgi:hypothetical protein